MAVDKSKALVVRVDELPSCGLEIEHRMLPEELGAFLPVAYAPAACGMTIIAQLSNSEDKVLARTSLDFAVDFQCSRCAESHHRAVSLSAQALFVPSHRRKIRVEELDFEPDSQELEELIDFDNNLLDLEPLIAQTVTTELDPYPLCSEQCLGLCAGCGENLNLSSCCCASSGASGAFSKLEALLKAKTQVEPQVGESSGCKTCCK